LSAAFKGRIAVDIRNLSLEILRDLYGSSRRLSMYPLGHPITQESLKKPLSVLNKIFAFKHSFAVELFKSNLLAEGILIEDTIYASGLALDMKKHNINNIVFSSSVNIGDLYHFLSLLVSRPEQNREPLDKELQNRDINCVTVNAERIYNLFRFDRVEMVNDTSRFLLADRIKTILSRKPEIIVAFYLGRLATDDDVLNYIEVDLRLGYVAGHFRDALKSLNQEKAVKLLEDVVFSANWLDDGINSDTVLGLRELFGDYLAAHPENNILPDIYNLFKKVGTPDAIMSRVFDKSSILKLRAFQETESIVNTLRFADPSRVDPEGLRKTVFKLAAAGQGGYLSDLLDQLLGSLSSPTNELRQKAMHLIVTAGDVLSSGGFFEEFNSICREALRIALLPTETLEPLELVAELSWQAIKKRRWKELKVLAGTLKGIRDDKSHPESKRSLAASKLIELSESSLLAESVSSIMDSEFSEDSGGLLDAMGELGSRETIRKLTEKIAHPDINVRSRVMRLLTSMRDQSAEVLAQILSELVQEFKGEAIDSQKWYYVRNILRVIKDIRAENAFPYLEIISNWPDSRIKLEVIKTLEGMPPEDAGKLLEKLSKDYDAEIRKTAVIAMGLTGHPDMVPRLKEAFKNQPDCRTTAVVSIGRIGSPEARDWLISVFEDEDLLTRMNLSKKEAEQLRIAILKSLSYINDETAVLKLEEYSRKSFSKSLFKKDLLSNTAKLILDTKSKNQS
jgi:HEAT repeat protein